MAVAISCGYGGYLLPLLAAHSSFFLELNMLYSLWVGDTVWNMHIFCFAGIMLMWFIYFYLFLGVASLAQGQPSVPVK